MSQPEHVNGCSASITVTDTDMAPGKNKKLMIYKVVIDTDGRCWFIFRRYKEFQTLYDKIKNQYKDADLRFPGKKLLSNLDPNFMKNRQEGLNVFVQQLMAHPGLNKNPDVRAFLNLDNPRQRSTDDDDEHGTITAGSGAPDSVANGDDDRINLGPSEMPHARPSDFEFLKVIGKGSFGKVFVAKHKTEGKTYAVKVLNKSHIMKKNEAKHIMSERNVLVKNVQHPFLVGLHYSFQTPKQLYFVLDYVNGGEMFFHLQRERCFSEGRAKFYSAEMASAIGYLHSLNIIYRDLKPENILLDSQGHIVLTDFGLCKEGIEGRGTTCTFCGTPEYLAPEVLRKQPYDKTVDWWCLGAVLYEMMFGLPPYYSRDTNEMYENILTKPLKFRNGVASSSARNILEGLLHKTKEKRLGAINDHQDIKTHPFYSSINWRLLNERAIKPPYNPKVASDMDLKHFDPEFVREPVPGSVGKSEGCVSASVKAADTAFLGFSYVPPDNDAFDYDS